MRLILRWRSFAGLLALAAVLGACGTGAPSSPAAAPPPSGPLTPEQRAALPGGLTVERHWLLSWFKGSPVSVTQRVDGAVTVSVPRSFCFDPGQSSVKPPLAAVLDKVAESLRRQPQAQLALAAPDDGGTHPALALQRAAQVQAQLRSRGVAARRLAAPTVASVAAVQLRLEAPPP